jgi:hypothetical protein
MLHDYELGHLSKEDRNEFELHLYECDHCASQVREFADVARIVKQDSDARGVVATLAKPPEKTTRLFLRLLVAALLVVVIAVPVYKYTGPDDTGTVNQTLQLLPTRSGGSDVIYLDKGGSVEITFFVSESHRHGASVLLTNIEGDTITVIDNYSEISEQGFGSIILPLSELAEGHYILTLSSPDLPDSARMIQYMFRVK